MKTFTHQFLPSSKINKKSDDIEQLILIINIIAWRFAVMKP
jgi:hypothetical protein